MTVVIVLILLVGINTLIWSTIGIIRVIAAGVRRARHSAPGAPIPTVDQVAVVIAAHNEELVITKTIRSAASLVPLANVFVASDGSSDETVAIAEGEGANVLDLHPNRGKAGALAAAIEHFRLADRFEVVLLLDADTQLASDYFTTGLELFDDPEVVAVAGRATTLPDAGGSSRMARIMLAYRERVYIAVQFLHKFGQAARHVNVVSIVPGFASMYRSRVLADIDIEAQGLAIEDYNMTFEVHAKRLGRIAFHPLAAIAYTQDPATLRDYMAQVSRWNLGFWQTVRRHGAHFGAFWLALTFLVIELAISSIVMITFFPLMAGLGALALTNVLDGDAPTFASDVVAAVPPLLVLLGVLIPDYVLTLFAAIVSRDARMLRFGLVFPFLRALDSYLCLRALIRAYRVNTSGVWVSPQRRSVESL